MTIKESIEFEKMQVGYETDNERYAMSDTERAYHNQLAGWLKTLVTIADMLDGTIDHLSGDDAKELLNDIKWELKGVEL